MAQESDFLPLLAQASRPSAGAGWKVKTVGYDAGRLTLDVLLADQREADSMLKRFDPETRRRCPRSGEPEGGRRRGAVRVRTAKRAMKEALKAFWERRTEGDRSAIAAAVILLSLAIAYAYAWLPVTRERDRLLVRVPELRRKRRLWSTMRGRSKTEGDCAAGSRAQSRDRTGRSSEPDSGRRGRNRSAGPCKCARRDCVGESRARADVGRPVAVRTRCALESIRLIALGDGDRVKIEAVLAAR
jgi:hypothetical protein